MKKKKIVFIISIFALIFIIKSLFLFNPLTFRRDYITHDSFLSYVKPVSILLLKNGESKEIKDVESDIKKIYKELKKSKAIGPVYDENLRKELEIPQTIGLFNIQSRENILTKIYWYGEESDYCGLLTAYDDNAYDSFIEMTPELKEIFKSYFQNFK